MTYDPIDPTITTPAAPQPPTAQVPHDKRIALRSLTLPAMQALLAEAGQPAYRAAQLYEWVFKRGAREFSEMTNLPRALREGLAERTYLTGMELVRVTGPEGGTRKALFKLADGRFIESVVMRDEGEGRTSLCISSQVGCAMGCTFCLTGFGGYQRNLTPDEIIGQAIEVRRGLLAPDEPLAHIVFMGMGEPMHNLDNVIPALRLLTDPQGFAHSRRRVTVSTVGVVPGIERFGKEALGVGLAVSLNATTDPVRSSIMPINNKWPIAQLLAAIRRYPLEARRRVTFEYVLLKGVNDTGDDARRLAASLRDQRCKVNLIMFNPSTHLKFEPVGSQTLDRFAGVLSDANLTVTVRWSKGREVEAACGQLAAHYFEGAHA